MRALLPYIAVFATSCLLFTFGGNASFWIDELYTVRVVAKPWGEFFRSLTQQEFVMGLYFVLMKPWTELFGFEQWTLRLPSLFLAGGVVTGAFALARRLWDMQTAALVAVMLLVNLGLWEAALDARTYALTALLAVWCFWVLLDLVEGGRGRTVLLFAVVASLLVYAQPTSALVVVSLIASVMLWGPRAVRSPVRRATLIWLALVAPLAIAFGAGLTRGINPTFWVPALSVVDLIDVVWNVFGGPPRVLVPVAIGVALFACTRKRKSDIGQADWVTRALAAWAVGPALVLALASLGPSHMLVPRYVLSSAPAGALLMARGLALSRPWTRRVLLSLFVTMTLVVIPATREAHGGHDFRGAMTAVQAGWQSGDRLVAVEARDAARYYLAGDIRVDPPILLPVVLEDGADFEAYKPRPKLNLPATLAGIGSPARIWVVLPYIPRSADAAADLELALLRRYRLVPKGTYGGVRVHLLVPRKSLSTQPLNSLTAK